MAAVRCCLALSLIAGVSAAKADGLAVGEWRVEGDTYEVTGGRALYSLTDQPYIVGSGSVAATVVVRKRPDASGWAAAGVMISADSGNLWTLTLVEGPAGERYTELAERYHDAHQAQGIGQTRLAGIEDGFGGTWEYGRAYRLLLALDSERVTGDITDVASGNVVARHGYLLADAPAVRDGWATLRAEQFDAEIADVKVVAAPAPQVASVRQYPQAKGGCVGLYLGEDLPGAEATPDLAGLREALGRAGFSTAQLSSRELLAEGTLAFPALRFLAADLRRVPADAMTPLRRWMQQGGVLISLTAPAFGRFYWPGGNGWLGWDEWSQQVLRRFERDARPIVDWSAEELTQWGQAVGGNARERAAMRVDGEAPDHLPAVSVALPHFGDGWWSTGREFGSPPARPGEGLVCFWAKGDGETPELSLELREKDGSRWVATFELTDRWRYCVLPPRAFAYWRDNPSEGRGGAGDEVRVENVVMLQWGISATHTRRSLAADTTEHRFSLGAVGLVAAPPEALFGIAPPARPEMEAVCPGYKLHEITGASRWEPTAAGQVWGISSTPPARAAYGAIERPQGEGFDRRRWWRWVPLVRAVAQDGTGLGVPVSLVLNETLALPRCACISVGAPRLADLTDPALQSAICHAAERLSSGPMLFEGGADRFLVYPDEAVTVGARVTSHATETAEGEVAIQVLGLGGKPAVPELKLPVTVRPRAMVAAQGTLPPLPADDYRVVTTLVVGGEAVDVIRHPLTVKARMAAPPASETVRREGGRLTLGGKPWHALGTNYWAHNLGGLPEDIYWTNWLHPVLYQPGVVEADLARLERMGFCAIAAVGADVSWGEGEDTPALRDLLDFLWRCQRHHIKVILFVGGLDPRGPDDQRAAAVIRTVRHHPALLGYDIAWEPSYVGSRRGLTPQWRDWLTVQYGSLEKAEAALGHALPRDGNGGVDAPADQWLAQDGPWNAVTAAYRAFMDYQIGIGYRRSAALVRSLDPWHLVGFRGNTPSWWGGFLPVEQLTVLHFMDWAGPEGYDVPAYGKVSPPGWVSSRGLCTRMLSFLSGGKPVMWMEFGLPIHPNGTEWDDRMIHNTAEQYQYQCEEGRAFWEMQAESGACGSFVWWYPGGFRVGENSDCGLMDPDNVARPVCEVARELLPKLAASGTRKADTWLEFRPESNPASWGGEYLRLRPEYERLRRTGKTIDVRTAGVGMTSSDCPLTDPAGRPWPGAGPLRYLNAVFERIRVRSEGAQWRELGLPTEPVKAVELRLPRGRPVELEAWAGNLAEAKWIAGDVKLSVGEARVPLEADVSFQGSGHFASTRVVGALDGPTTVRLQVGVEGRGQFGEIVELVLTPEE